ncbi:MAG TPA: hypothetical protein VMV22_11400 [Acidimicrobiales bacterium]|nr:hypothetical protein [Acidimicrobiales bacterium]
MDGHPGPGAGAGAAPTSVKDVLQSTSLTILEAHLTWLCARTRLEGQLSPRRVLFEDQARVLIDALDERGALEVVTGSLQSLWIAEDVPDDDDDITTYASDLDMVTAGQPPYSPYVALAQSAAKVHAEIRNHRRSTSPLRPG